MSQSRPSDEAAGCFVLIFILAAGVIWYNWGLLAAVGVLCCFLVGVGVGGGGEGKKDDSALKTLHDKHWALKEKYDQLSALYQELSSQYRELRLKGSPTPAFHARESRREISQREFAEKLHELGFQTYEEYLRSDVWRKTKRRYYSSEYPQFCLVCGSKSFELHHRTYARLGHEELYDFVPLCPSHHDALHKLLDDSPHLCVKDTHDYLGKLDEASPSQDQGVGRGSADARAVWCDDEIPF